MSNEIGGVRLKGRLRNNICFLPCSFKDIKIENQNLDIYVGIVGEFI